MDDRTATEDLHAVPTRHPSSRRAVFGGVLGLGVALPVLAACGSGDEEASSGGSPSEAESSAGGSGDAGASADSDSSGAADALTTTGDVPVGGGAIFEEQKVVVTQPTEGDFKAFSATCTHQGCLVTEVTDGGIDCACHGSIFSIEDGSVVEGPAEEALAEMTVTVDGDNISVS